MENCFVMNELILRLAHEKKIELDLDELALTNHVTVTMISNVSLSWLFYEQKEAWFSLRLLSS